MIYQAILQAADHIESHPNDFDFGTVEIPHSCGSPGCALGWIGHFAKVRRQDEDGIRLVARTDWDDPRLPCLLNLKQEDFYSRMAELADPDKVDTEWMHDAADCAKRLRLYAEKFHGQEKQRSTSAMVADLMARITGPRIPDEVES